MNIADAQTYQRYRANRISIGEVLLTMLIFASMGAITWAIRGTSGWGGIEGAIVPGMTWGVWWWYICWRKGIDARGVPLWLGLGIALGGELGYGQYVSWIRGTFNVSDDVVPIAPWLGYAWFAMCGIGWGGFGGIALGWALAGKKSLGVWLARLLIPVGLAILARLAVQTWPWLFFPNWHLGVYVPEVDGVVDAASAANAQRNMIVAWFASASLGVLAWYANAGGLRSGWTARGISLGAVAAMIVLLLLISRWLFFPNDQLGLAGDLGRHLGRTVYTNSQNAIVVGWWIGALLVAAIGRDRYTLFAGLVIGVGFGAGFSLAALWCLGYSYAPNLVDWWKMWELQSGFNLGLAYVVVLYWATRQVDENREAGQNSGLSMYRRWCETSALALGVFLAVYLMARENFITVGVLLGLLYVFALFQATRYHDGVQARRRGLSFVYSVFLLVFIMAWGASAQAGVLLGLYDAKAVDQYSWSSARITLFAPIGILICSVAVLNVWYALRNPQVGLPSSTDSMRICARMVDLMTFTGVVGAASIWPAKIGVLYACFLGLALFAFNRLNCRLDRVEASLKQDQ